MVIRMRHTRAHRDNRRSHHALKAQNFSPCPKCKAPRLPHTLCEKCGVYKGREVVDVIGIATKKEAKRKARAGNDHPAK